MDKKLKALKARVMQDGCSLAVMNAVLEAEAYTGILDAVVRAGSLQNLSDKLGVSYQAVQQWMKQGHVPLARIAEIQTYYDVPRTDLMNQKYVEAVSGPNFPDTVLIRVPKEVPILDLDDSDV